MTAKLGDRHHYQIVKTPGRIAWFGQFNISFNMILFQWLRLFFSQSKGYAITQEKQKLGENPYSRIQEYKNK